ncbi:MAG: F0F1 ATP synthase subunit B [Ignavibacteria bacterium]|nr:F0F1 ATP synthase subunit B [Ignavibacteria bacterium]
MLLYLLHNLLFGIFLSGDTGHERPSLLSVNPGLIIWTIVVFILFLVLLKKFAWGPLIKSLNDREANIKSALENAELQRKNTEALVEENKRIISEANANASKILNEARDLAVKLKAEIVTKANDEANRNLDIARTQIESMKDTALENLKDDITDIALKAAEKIIMQNLDRKKHVDLIEDFLKKIPKN